MAELFKYNSSKTPEKGQTIVIQLRSYHVYTNYSRLNTDLNTKEYSIF